MNQNGYESTNQAGYGQPYTAFSGGYTPPVSGPYFASNQPNGIQPGASGYPFPQGGGNAADKPELQGLQGAGYQNSSSLFQGTPTGGYQAPVSGYQPPQAGGYQGAGYFNPASAVSGYSGAQSPVPTGGVYGMPAYGLPVQNGVYAGQISGGYPSAYSGAGGAYAARPSMASSGSYIPPTPYSTVNTNPDYRQIQVGYQQGFNAISQMGRNPQSAVPAQKTASQQMPLNGGGYTPERVPVKRQPFEATDIMVYAAGGILVLIFVLALFVFNSSALKIIFILLAGGTTSFLWLKPVTAENKRLCYTIVALALCIATVVSLFVPSGKNNSGGNNTGESGQKSSGSTTQQTLVTPAPQTAANTGGAASYDAAAAAKSAEEDEATKQRLYLFFQYWNANRLEEMLTVCAPSWISKQESPKTSLFQILKNRIPINFEIIDMKGTSQDKSRQIILRCEIDRHTGKDTTVWYQLSVLMLKEGEQWYVDPLSIQTNEEETTPDPNITPTPAPTPEPRYDANTVLYYNPDGGSMYHADPNCQIINPKYLPLKGRFTYGQINDPNYAGLEPCNVCNAPLR